MIKIYTDGSCLKNPGDGGWAVIIIKDGDNKVISGSEKDTTNNRMELLAPINALKKMKPNEQIEIYTDSQYVKLGITEWINKWIVNNWKTSKKDDVKNKDLWIELYNLNKSLNVKWNWVKAHAGNPMNEKVDLLAKKAASLN
jgi:ribonuclease HI